MKPLVIYYSNSGNNERLALRIKNSLGCEVLEIKEKKKRGAVSILFDLFFNRSTKLSEHKISNYEQNVVMLVAPVWGGKIATPMRAFAEQERKNIHKYFLITLCNGGEGQREKIAAELSSIIQREPLGVTELGINRLLPEDKRNKIKYTFHYKVSDDDLDRFEEELKELVNAVVKACEPV